MMRRFLFPRRAGHGKRLGEAAGFVELDIDRLIAGEAHHIGKALAAFVGAERH